MNKTGISEQEKALNSNRISPRKSPQCCSGSSSKLSIYLIANLAALLILFQIQSLQTPLESSWKFMHHWQNMVTNSTLNPTFHNCNKHDDINSITSKLRESVTFLPLKDLRYANEAHKGHTWFMSSMYDTQEQGEVQYQQFPTNASKGRVLCLKGRDTHDGSWNSYALAYPYALPHNATLKKGVTFVSYNHYDYSNLWHGLSTLMPFVAWHIKSHCASPERWILYHWGELRLNIGPWVRSVMEATFSGPLNIETLIGIEDGPFCFEKAVVMRHNEGGMSRVKRIETYDLMRCKARKYCNVSMDGRIKLDVNEKGLPIVVMTMLLRIGARSFKNESEVIRIFDAACRKVEGCRLVVAHANNLTFCEQVRLMSTTDVLISPHGAQLTNMFFMDKNSSVMEFFPKGWLKLAGVGQKVHHWLASWSGMNHRGMWHDPDGDHCPYSEDDRRCMSVFKNGKIGHNETYFSEWAINVLNDQVKLRKTQLQEQGTVVGNVSGVCGCS